MSQFLDRIMPGLRSYLFRISSLYRIWNNEGWNQPHLLCLDTFTISRQSHILTPDQSHDLASTRQILVLWMTAPFWLSLVQPKATEEPNSLTVCPWLSSHSLSTWLRLHYGFHIYSPWLTIMCRQPQIRHGARANLALDRVPSPFSCLSSSHSHMETKPELFK